MKEQCVIVSAGTYGQIYAEYLKKDYLIIGFIDDDKALLGRAVRGIKVIGDFNYLLSHVDQAVRVFVPIGQNTVRKKMLAELKIHGFTTPNYIHPTANIDSSVNVATSAVYILQGVIIMPLSVIKEGVMISAGTIISHHTTIEQGVFISFGVNVGASLKIKSQAYLGIACTIMTGVKTVGSNSLIGAGCVIIHDVPDGATVVGNPGRIIKIASEAR